MTKREHDLLQFICAYHTENGYSPSYTEMATALGLRSKSTIHALVMALLDRGLLCREGNATIRSVIPAGTNSYERGYADGFRAAIGEVGNSSAVDAA